MCRRCGGQGFVLYRRGYAKARWHHLTQRKKVRKTNFRYYIDVCPKCEGSPTTRSRKQRSIDRVPAANRLG